MCTGKHLEASNNSERACTYEKILESNTLTWESNKELGAIGEDIAFSYLTKLGYFGLHRNWRCKLGEIDLVMRDGDVLVFVEVKTRGAKIRAYRRIFDNITQQKSLRLRKLTEVYKKRYFRCRVPIKVRIDVVGVIVAKDNAIQKITIRHIKAAI